jgi:hypothetical protein
MTDHSASAPSRDDSVLSIEQVLVAEADAIHGEGWRAGLTIESSGQDAQDRRTRLNRDRHEQRQDSNHDQHSHDDIPGDEIESREELYRRLNGLNRAALCCSGGAISSATFCLGVIQALAECDVTQVVPRTDSAPMREGRQAEGRDDDPKALHKQRANQGAGKASAAEDDADALQRRAPAKTPEPIDPKNSLLGRFAYLSTVAGGGYVGSWLSSWHTRDQFDTIIENLTERPGGADVEPSEISRLRDYSNYLTPSLGIASAETWALIAIVVRNLVLNWLVIIPVLCVALLALKLIAAVSVTVAYRSDDGWLVLFILAAGIVCLLVAQAFTTRHRPTRRSLNGNVDERRFLLGDFIWSVAAAIAVTIFFTSRYFWSLVGAGSSFVETAWPGVLELGLTQKVGIPIVTAGAGFFIYLIGWLLGLRFGDRWLIDWFWWGLSGLIYGALVGFGAYLFITFLNPYPVLHLSALLVAIILGVPWVLMAQFVSVAIFSGFPVYSPLSHVDRLWLARAAGWLAATAIIWAIAAFLIFADAHEDANSVAQLYVLGPALCAAAIVVFLGSGSYTPATAPGSKMPSDFTLNLKVATITLPVAAYLPIVLQIAGLYFVVALVIELSIVLDQVMFGRSLVSSLLAPNPPIESLAAIKSLAPLGIGAIVAAGIGSVASRCVDINQFSLHAMRCDRLIGGYLSATRRNRTPDLFTGLDSRDNVRMCKLWPPKSGGKVDVKCLFHVINIAVNLSSTKRLAWQDRKTESFTVTPTHSGSTYLGFRPSADYGDSLTVSIPGQQGIALGTAMAISGAYENPARGYHRSPWIGLLLTLFSARLGWWLGNPGRAGSKQNAYRRERPRSSALPPLFQALGQNTDDEPYVYLSDGRHFEGLGLYEMVRRRCRFIILVDAGSDPNFTFAGLGNAVRKIYIDLGVRITFEWLGKLHNRPDPDTIKAAGKEGIPYHALGTIHYVEADGKARTHPACRDGYILYIKPAYHGTNEGAGVRSYAATNKDFPHETSVDRGFIDSQFETYRLLGLDMTREILRNHLVQQHLHDFLHLAPG